MTSVDTKSLSTSSIHVKPFLAFSLPLAVGAPSEPRDKLLLGDEACSSDDECASGVCRDALPRSCSAPSSALARVRGNDFCRLHTHCFSGLCLDQLCALDSAIPGKARKIFRDFRKCLVPLPIYNGLMPVEVVAYCILISSSLSTGIL